MASIEKTTTSDGRARYKVRWRVGGRAVEKWVPTLAAARTLKTQAENDALTGVGVDPRGGARTLNDYFGAWLPARLTKSGRPLAPATAIGYERLWRRNIRAGLGNRQLRSLRRETIRTWHGELSTSAGADQAAKSYRLLRAVLATAEYDELIRHNPCGLRGAGQENAPERPWVETSVVLDLATAIEPRYRAMVMLAGFAGFRTGESLGLRRCDVDPLHREVNIVVQAQELTGRGRTVSPPKTDAGVRSLAVPTVVIEALEEHMAAFCSVDAGPDAPLFTGPRGTPLRRATWSNAWRAAVKAAGAPEGLHPHDLRHHSGTVTARMPGITTKELMARLGHASPRAALIYQHATRPRDHAVAAYLDGVVGGAAPSPTADVLSLGRTSVGERTAPLRGADAGLGPPPVSDTGTD